MARPATGSLTETRPGVWRVRFRAYGRRFAETWHGIDRAEAERRLRHRLADVDRDLWTAPEPEPETDADAIDPTFGELAAKWYARHRRELTPNGRTDLEWRLDGHLLPAFGATPLREIGIAEVDGFRDGCLARWEAATAAREAWEALDPQTRGPKPAKAIGPASINKCLVTLGQILDVALEGDLIARNPMRVRTRARKCKVRAPERHYIDSAEAVAALLDAAADIDRERDGMPWRRTLLAVLALGGLRVGEALALRWRDVDLARGELRVTESKTDTGVRDVALLPALREALAEHRAAMLENTPDGEHRLAALHLFGTSGGKPQSYANVRTRLFVPAVTAASDRLVTAGKPPLPDGLRIHDLRRTAASIAFALGQELPVVMASFGWAEPSTPLRVYARIMRRDATERDALRTLAGLDTSPAITAGDRDPAGHR